MIGERLLGILLVLVGAAGAAIAALADPIGLGEGNTFGWLQLTGVIAGGVAIVLGLALGIPHPGRRAAIPVAGAGAAPRTVITDSTRRRRAA